MSDEYKNYKITKTLMELVEVQNKMAGAMERVAKSLEFITRAIKRELHDGNEDSKPPVQRPNNVQ